MLYTDHSRKDQQQQQPEPEPLTNPVRDEEKKDNNEFNKRDNIDEDEYAVYPSKFMHLGLFIFCVFVYIIIFI